MSEEQFETVREESVQTRAKPKQESQFGAFVLSNLYASSYIVPNYYSRRRDKYLKQTVLDSDHLSGAVNNLCSRISAIPSHVEPRDLAVKAHQKLAAEYNIIWNEMTDFGKGKQNLMYKVCEDWYIQDNGMFMEIIGDGPKDGPIIGPALSVAHLDSSRCYRTGDMTFPVVYMDTDGRRHALHYTRVAFSASMPSTDEEMYEVGYCAVSRCLNNVQHLIDIGIFEQEKMGSRPKRQILITQGGLDPEDVKLALQMADSSMSNEGLARFSKAILMGDSTLPEAALESIDLASIPDGFEKQSSNTIGMFVIALAFGVPVRWLWPATQAGATKADAMFQHVAGQGPGVGFFLQTLTTLLAGSPDGLTHLAGKFLPPTLRLVFDFQDDEQDRSVAEIKKTRIEGWSMHLESATMDVRTVREQMLRAGDLTESQFRRLELEDGRLPDGKDVLSLFTATDDLTLRLLDLGVENPLAITANDPVELITEIDAAAIEAQDIVTNPISIKQKRIAEEAMSALGKLKTVYTDLLTQEIQQEVEAGLTGEEEPQEKPQEEDETKQFNFGAQSGEIIRGALAREGGQFINAADLKAQIRAGLIARLRGQEGTEGLTKAELKRAKNRELVGSELGESGTVDALALLRSGEQPDAETAQGLVERGLATVENGIVVSTPRGRSLVRAANSGDIDAARAALKPKPKKGGKGGGKTAQDRENERIEKRDKNRVKVRDSLDMNPDNFDALLSFDDGKEISGEQAKALASDGLVEFDAQGNARLTAQGRKMVCSADKGDKRDAQDVLSVGRDKVAKTEEKATEALERADNIDNQVSELESSLDPESPNYDPDNVDAITEKIEKLREQAQDQRDRADELLSRIGKGGTTKERLTYKAAVDDFQLAVRSSFRRLWSNIDSRFEFIDGMVRVLERGLRRAWNQGAAKCGIEPDELTNEEIEARDNFINSQFQYLGGVADWIIEKRQQAIRDGKIPSVRNMPVALFTRAQMWVGRFGEAESLSMSLACKDKKLKWFYNPLKEHCADCEKYHLRVYRASIWRKYNIHPKSWHLACKGRFCGCFWEETDDPVTPGRPPGTTG